MTFACARLKCLGISVLLTIGASGWGVAQHGAPAPVAAHAVADSAVRADSIHADSAHAAAAHDTAHAAGHGAHAADAHGSGRLDVKAMLFHHIVDNHDWHLTDIPKGDGTYTPVALHLPYIVYRSDRGFEFFSLHGHDHHERATEAAERGYTLDHYGVITGATTPGVTVVDLSITKMVLQMLIIAVLLVIVFTAVARSLTRGVGKAPTGLANAVEPIIVFIRDEVAKPNLHGKHDRYLPYLLSLFFFIWFANLLGLTPLNSNIAGNISFTAALAVLTFLIVQFSGTKDYWGHIFNFPGVPLPVKFILTPIELISLFIKPMALMIRLFANIVAGHFMVLSLLGLIFILYDAMGTGGALGIMPLSLGFTFAIMLLELLVAVIQAYIFTLLTTVFIGQALESHDHGHGHDHAHDAHHPAESSQH